jgi:hypothetical protein
MSRKEGIKNFENMWEELRDIIQGLDEVRTLSRGNINRIVKVTETSITVQNIDTLVEREISKEDFEYAWEVLESQGKLYMEDLAPRLHGRKAIIMALLNKLPYISYSNRPVTLHLLRE